MPRTLRTLMVMAALVAIGTEADAQYNRGRRGGSVMMTPDGPIANPSAEYLMYMRNPAGYEQAVMQHQQKMMATQQKQMVQYQKEQAKQQKAYQDWAKKNPEQAAALQKQWEERNTPKARTSKKAKPKSKLGKNGLPKPEDDGEQVETIVSSLAKAKAKAGEKPAAKPEPARAKDEKKGEKAEAAPEPKKS